MAIFAEGTRLTEAKRQASVEYARANGLPELNHHLLPRSKGFSMTVQYFKDKGKEDIQRCCAFNNNLFTHVDLFIVGTQTVEGRLQHKKKIGVLFVPFRG